jgi:hypothetical protein
MSYTGSQAQSGNGVIFAINTGTAQSPTYTTIAEVLDFSQTGKQNKTADVTNLQSSAEEFIATITSPGKYDLTFNRVSGDAGQAAVKASFDAKTVVMYQITLPKTGAQTSTGDSYKFTALVEEFDDVSGVSPTKQIQSKSSLKVTGPITLTVGS